ncbi:MAG: hypothetical protein LBI06_01295 [Treponema sp.]|jgi:hypothetical protein|nr:hypothetical protein [Treponema sp.]
MPFHEFAAKVKAVLGSFRDKAAEMAGDLRLRMQLGVDRLAEKLKMDRRRLSLVIMGGSSAVLLLVMAVMVLTKGKPEDMEAVTAGIMPTGQALIPPEELFLPEEPDFVPGVMPERAQRTAWTAADAAFLWQDPLKSGEEHWRNRIEKTIDEIMESVP